MNIDMSKFSEEFIFELTNHPWGLYYHPWEYDQLKSLKKDIYDTFHETVETDKIEINEIFNILNKKPTFYQKKLIKIIKKMREIPYEKRYSWNFCEKIIKNIIFQIPSIINSVRSKNDLPTVRWLTPITDDNIDQSEIEEMTKNRQKQKENFAVTKSSKSGKNDTIDWRETVINEVSISIDSEDISESIETADWTSNLLGIETVSQFLLSRKYLDDQNLEDMVVMLVVDFWIPELFSNGQLVNDISFTDETDIRDHISNESKLLIFSRLSVMEKLLSLGAKQIIITGYIDKYKKMTMKPFLPIVNEVFTELTNGKKVKFTEKIDDNKECCILLENLEICDNIRGFIDLVIIDSILEENSSLFSINFTSNNNSPPPIWLGPLLKNQIYQLSSICLLNQKRRIYKTRIHEWETVISERRGIKRLTPAPPKPTPPDDLPFGRFVTVIGASSENSWNDPRGIKKLFKLIDVYLKFSTDIYFCSDAAMSLCRAIAPDREGEDKEIDKKDKISQMGQDLVDRAKKTNVLLHFPKDLICERLHKSDDESTGVNKNVMKLIKIDGKLQDYIQDINNFTVRGIGPSSVTQLLSLVNKSECLMIHGSISNGSDFLSSAPIKSIIRLVEKRNCFKQKALKTAIKNKNYPMNDCLFEENDGTTHELSSLDVERLVDYKLESDDDENSSMLICCLIGPETCNGFLKFVKSRNSIFETTENGHLVFNDNLVNQMFDGYLPLGLGYVNGQ
eukprot:GHVL01013974.1.p1 GENE.GHVL01013974.1~~GHVL01013974.1.p1  ORF type:complete len:861 (+),score=231.10 GHVL01013974.1:380-2584(+)